MSIIQIPFDEERFYRYLNNIPHAAVLLDQKGYIVQVNGIVLEVSQKSQEYFQGQPYHHVVDGEKPFDRFVQALNHEPSRQYPVRLLPPQAKAATMTQIVLFTVETGNAGSVEKPPVLYYGLIFPEVNRTLNLNLSERFLESVMTHVNSGVLAVDVDGRITAISDMACYFLDVQKEQVLYRRMDELFSELPTEYRILEITLHDGVPYRDHAISWTLHGKRYDLLVDSYLLKNESGVVEGAYAMFKDVTNLRSVDGQIQHNERLAMIGQIAAGTAHEIRNPLTSIKGFLQMIQHALEEKGLQKELEYVQITMTELERINQLIGEFLMLSKPKNTSYQTLKVTDTLREILPFIETEAKMKGIQVITRLKSRMPPVIANSELLKQVFINISKNGIEAMEKGGTLTISQHLDQAGRMLVVDIRDTGPGIPPYVVDRIFDPFFTTKENGTGLGLSVCQRILHDMGGSLTLSTKGFGTTFHIHLPIK